MSGTASISGGVAQFSFGSVSGKSFYFRGVVANHRTSKKMSSATSGNSDNVRSDGLWWFGTHTSNTSIYIRACCNGDKDNDST
ncbi:hypothetical protein [Intestinibacter sp.]|uniref:hypothetical protein n=1 Tax=Intestinibacter sp. TaxID=1965304 RepID=UPI003F15DA74